MILWIGVTAHPSAEWIGFENPQTGNGDPLASRRLPDLLAPEIESTRWLTEDTAGDSHCRLVFAGLYRLAPGVLDDRTAITMAKWTYGEAHRLDPTGVP